MKIAFMFPGQGSQYKSMGYSIYNFSEESKIFFEKTNTLLNFSLTDIMFTGDEEVLKQTQNTQPAILTHSISLWNLIKKNILPQNYAVIGHSLGEYSAYIASERMSFDEGVLLVRKRGWFMSEVSSPDFGMAAILKMPIENLESILKMYSNDKVFLANDNCPGQIVVSGLKSQIEVMSPFIKEQGGRVIMLPVSGAFHSPFMKEASAKLHTELLQVPFQQSFIPLYTNVDTMPIQKGYEVESLTQQVYKGVLFTNSIRRMIADGYGKFIEVGPGNILQGLVKKIDPNVTVLGVENPEDIDKLKKEF